MGVKTNPVHKIRGSEAGDCAGKYLLGCNNITHILRPSIFGIDHERVLIPKRTIEITVYHSSLKQTLDKDMTHGHSHINSIHIPKQRKH
jgi:hypothetical protein